MTKLKTIESDVIGSVNHSGFIGLAACVVVALALSTASCQARSRPNPVPSSRVPAVASHADESTTQDHEKVSRKQQEKDFCNPDSSNYIFKQKQVKWKHIPKKRVHHLVNKDSVRMATISLGGRPAYIYKTYVMFSNAPPALIAPVTRTKYDQVVIGAINYTLLLKHAAKNSALQFSNKRRNNGFYRDMDAYGVFAPRPLKLHLWALNSKNYFTIGKDRKFDAFALRQSGVRFVCYHK